MEREAISEIIYKQFQPLFPDVGECEISDAANKAAQTIADSQSPKERAAEEMYAVLAEIEHLAHATYSNDLIGTYARSAVPLPLAKARGNHASE